MLVLVVPANFNRLARHRGRVNGVVVTDYHVNAGSSTLTKGVFPANGAALVVARSLGPQVTAPPLRLPFSLEELQGPQHRPDGTAWNGVFRFKESLYAISFWAGRSAPSRDAAALRHALTSLQRAQG